MQGAVDLTDDVHPDKITRVANLGVSQRICFQRLGVLTEINDSITNLQGAVDRTDESHPDKPLWLCNLGSSHIVRYERLGNLADLETPYHTCRKQSGSLITEIPTNVATSLILVLGSVIALNSLGSYPILRAPF